MATHNDLGRQGEEIAKAYLEEHNYEILDETWVYGNAEIDLIAYRNGTRFSQKLKAEHQ